MKVFGQKFNHQFLRTKLTELWKFQETITLIDLGFDFYPVKFDKEDSQQKALHEGQWFIAGSFLSVRIWEPNFIPIEAKLQTTVIWLSLPQLPTEFYDKIILERIGTK